jgi:prepilin-type N-terminal cleavage/methylation domain-containing protein/prepilin-type processing-associated H-X9-DG protein
MQNPLSSKLAFAALFAFACDFNLISCPFIKEIPQMKKKYSRSFTLIEFLVVVAVIGILFALAIPAFTAALDRAKATKDMSNLRQLGLAMQAYLNDKDQILPATATWPGTASSPVLYPKYIGTRQVFQSPFDKRASSEANDGTPPVSYSINDNLYAAAVGLGGNMLKVVSPASTFMMAPNYPSGSGDPRNVGSWPGTTGNAPDLPVAGGGETRGTHSNGRQINVLFCDLHTETLTFGPAGTTGTFQDITSTIGMKHWDPRQ